MPRPSTDPLEEWATDVDATLSEPSQERKEMGWEPFQPQPAGQTNWIIQRMTEWINYLQGGGTSAYATLQAAAADLAVGEIGLVDENDMDNFPGQEVESGGTAGAECADLCVTGQYVVYCTDGVNDNPKLFERDDLDTVVRTFTKTNAGVTQCVISDGTNVYCAYGNYVEAWLISSGASLWVYDHGATVYCLAVYANTVAMGGAVGTGTKEVRGLSKSAGTASWSYRHNGTVFSMCVANRALIIGGNASGHASGANLRALHWGTGNDFNNEGGTALDSTGTAWDKVMANAIIVRGLATDGKNLYVWQETANEVHVLGLTDGIDVASRAMPAHDGGNLAVDQDYLFIGGYTGVGANLYALDKRTLATAWHNLDTTRGRFSGVATDGAGVFLAVTTTAVGVKPTLRVTRHNRPSKFLRPDLTVAGDHIYANNPRYLIPVE